MSRIRTRREAIEDIREKLPSYADEVLIKLHPQDKMYICEFCKSGTGKHKTGAFGVFRGDDGKMKWSCRSCGKSGDIFDLIAHFEHKQTFEEQLEWACDTYGIEIVSDGVKFGDNKVSSQQSIQNHADLGGDSALHQNEETEGTSKNQANNKQSEKEIDYTKFCNEAHKHIGETSYHRGLSDSTLERFNVGFDSQWRHPKRWRDNRAPYLIIPTSKTSYAARLAIDNQKGHANVGNVHIFNVEALEKAQKRIFVVEGEIDAMSIVDVGGEAIGIGGTTGVGRLIDYLKGKNERQAPIKPIKPLVLAMDNDELGEDGELEKGQKANIELANKLRELTVEFCIFNGYGSYKDANEMLMADREALKRAVEDAEMLELERMEVEQEMMVSDGQLDALEVEQDVEATFSVLQDMNKGVAVGIPFYADLRQGKETNLLASFRDERGKTFQYVPENKNWQAQVSAGFFLSISCYNLQTGFRESTQLLLDFLMMDITSKWAKTNHVEASLDQYMEIRELADKRETIRQLKIDLITLSTSAFVFENPFRVIPISGDEAKVEHGVIYFTFSNAFLNLVREYAIIPYPVALMKIKTNIHRNSRALGRKIITHMFMNIGRPNENILKVDTLLENAPYLPKYEDVMKGNRDFRGRIINTFFDDLDALSEIFTWSFYKQNENEPLTREALGELSYKDFKDGKIVFTLLHDFPNRKKLIGDRKVREAKQLKKQDVPQKPRMAARNTTSQKP